MKSRKLGVSTNMVSCSGDFMGNNMENNAFSRGIIIKWGISQWPLCFIFNQILKFHFRFLIFLNRVLLHSSNWTGPALWTGLASKLVTQLRLSLKFWVTGVPPQPTPSLVKILLGKQLCITNIQQQVWTPFSRKYLLYFVCIIIV